MYIVCIIKMTLFHMFLLSAIGSLSFSSIADWNYQF